VELAHAAQRAGVDGLLVVTPYYNKPPQEGLIRHFTAAADATELPVMLYDIPGRCGTEIETETLVRLAEHPRIVAVKDAKGDLAATSWVLARCGLAYYSGEDMLNLPLLSVGAVGFASVVSHIVTGRLRGLVESYEAGDVVRATALHRELLPVYMGIFRGQGVVMIKAVLNSMGLPAGPVRSPLLDATPQQRAVLAKDLAAAGIVMNDHSAMQPAH
jgi:4-hydroxy-tetrahydrodipicolinate synthase